MLGCEIMEEMLTRCYSCLAELVFPEGKSIVRCDCCARYNDRPKSEKKEADLMKYAHERRNLGEFDKAEAAYEEVLKKNLGEHEARWGVLLCKRGVIYLEDAVTGESVITCRRKASGSIMTEPDFRQACEDAPLQVRRQYERDAEYIDAIQREIRSLEREQPYDVFICYKETEPGTGVRTEDSRRAMNIYQTLERRGYRAFYAPVSLKDHLGANYEAAIFHAIETAQVMLVLGTKPDYFRTTWMQSEWSRFLEKVDAHEPKLLVPLYADFQPNCLPVEFSDRFIQGLDMSDVGFMFDLESMLNRVIRGSAGKAEPEKPVGESEEVKKLREAMQKMQEEMERLQREKAEEEHIAEAARKAEEERLAAEVARRAEEERIAAEAVRREEAERIAAEAARRGKAMRSAEVSRKAEEESRKSDWSLDGLDGFDWDSVLDDNADHFSGTHTRSDNVRNGVILNSWPQILAAVKTGVYREIYQIGDTKELDLGPEGKVEMQIVAFDADERADGKGKAPITWISKGVLRNKRRMNPPHQADNSNRKWYSITYKRNHVVGTGTIGGWEKCELRRALNEEIMPLLPKQLAERIVTVNKTHKAMDGELKYFDQTTEDALWIPGYEELFDEDSPYAGFFRDDEDRIKRREGGKSPAWWMTRTSPNGWFGFLQVCDDGNYAMDTDPAYVALGFCT